MMNTTDAELMVQAKQGNDEAFAALFAKYRRPIVSFCRRMLKEQGRAEEAAQETFTRIYRAKERYEPTTEFRHFIFRVASNTCLNILRKGDRLVREEEGEISATERIEDTQTATPDEVLAADRLQKDIHAALAELSPTQRTAFVLLRFQDMSYDEIAREMDLSVSAVKSHLNRARTELLKLLAPHVETFTMPYLRTRQPLERSVSVKSMRAA